MTRTTNKAGQQEEGLTQQASAKVQDAAATAQEKASELRGQGSARLSEEFDRRSNDAGSQMRTLADAVRRSGSEFGDGENRTTARVMDEAADQIERLGSYLERTRGDELMRDVESFARRRPWLIAGFGMVAGLALARFVKATSEQRYEGRRARAGLPAAPAQRSSDGWSAEARDAATEQPLARDRSAGAG